MSDGTRTVMRRAVYSPCELCPDNPAPTPLWRLKAERVIHDQVEHSITYRDASLEFFGLPILYTPYFRHPDPSVTRQSGFLTPSYSSSTALGAEVTIPYYWSLAPDRDVTFSPRFTALESAVLAGEYRERTQDGQFTIDASITRALTADEDGDRIRDTSSAMASSTSTSHGVGASIWSAPSTTPICAATASRRKTIWSRPCLQNGSTGAATCREPATRSRISGPDGRETKARSCSLCSMRIW